MLTFVELEFGQLKSHCLQVLETKFKKIADSAEKVK
jgi:hypothetical protein